VRQKQEPTYLIRCCWNIFKLKDISLQSSLVYYFHL